MNSYSIDAWPRSSIVVPPSGVYWVTSNEIQWDPWLQWLITYWFLYLISQCLHKWYNFYLGVRRLIEEQIQVLGYVQTSCSMTFVLTSVLLINLFSTFIVCSSYFILELYWTILRQAPSRFASSGARCYTLDLDLNETLVHYIWTLRLQL